jgi:hypothetical protein
VASANLLSEPTIFLGKCLYQVRNVTVVPLVELLIGFVGFCGLSLLNTSHSQGPSDMWQCPVKIGLVQKKSCSLLDQMTSRNLEHLLCGVCECPINLMLGPVIHTLLLDRMSIQLQFTLGNTGMRLGVRYHCYYLYSVVYQQIWRNA